MADGVMTSSGGVINDSPVPWIGDKLDKPTTTGSVKINFSSSPDTEPSVTTLAAEGDVTVRGFGAQKKDLNTSLYLAGGAKLVISGDNNIAQAIVGVGRFDASIYKFSTSLADGYFAVVGFFSADNNKQKGRLALIDAGGGLRLDAKIMTDEGYLRWDTSLFTLYENNHYYDIPSRNTFVLSLRWLFEIKAHSFKFTLPDAFAYFDTLNPSATRFKVKASAGYLASENIECGVEFNVTADLAPPKPDIKKVYKDYSVYVKAKF